MIKQLKIHELRNLKQVNLTLAACNLIVGANGSGKTSLLEAVFLLSRGKSFRHHEPKRYIRHHQSACTVWARTTFEDSCTLAIQKKLDETGKSDTILRFNDHTVPTQSTLSFHLPTLLIDPVSMSLLDEGSVSRRQMLDWLAFHIQPKFYHQWLQYQRLLKQRNALLKQPGIHHKLPELFAWDEQLGFYAHALHEHRLAVFDQWVGYFDEMIKQLLPEYHSSLSLQYLAGFDHSESLSQTLKGRLNQDIDLGYTRIGAHRADVNVKIHFQNDQGQKIREQATHILSRGEKKLLITALKLSQLKLMCHAFQEISVQTAHPPVVLIDDLDAELDDDAIEILLKTVLSLPCQVIITSLNAQTHQKILVLKPDISTATSVSSQPNTEDLSYKMFHVEQGEFQERYTS